MSTLQRRSGLGAAVENYAKAIYALQRRGDAAVTTNALAERLGVTPASASGMVKKLGALGLRVRRWVTLHGFSVNLAPKLSHFSGIVPCGIAESPVTSLDEMGLTETQPRFDLALRLRLDEFLFSLEGG